MTEVDPARSASGDIPVAVDSIGVCPRCGNPVAVSEPAAGAQAEPPMAVAESTIAVDRAAQGRGAGLLTLALLCAPSAIPAAVALVLLTEGKWIGGFILVGLALVSAALLLVAVGREEDGTLGRQALAVAARAQVQARMARVSLAAWSRALRSLMRVRRRQQRLYAARKDRLAALGEAVLRGDRTHAARLQAETRDLGEEMRARDDEASAAIDSARERIERERAAGRAIITRVG
jgi:hypothetical protein